MVKTPSVDGTLRGNVRGIPNLKGKLNIMAHDQVYLLAEKKIEEI